MAPRRHDADADGQAELREAEQAVREGVWTALREQKQARFPGAHARIPNFVGAEAAADRLQQTEQWARARTVTCNPDRGST